MLRKIFVFGASTFTGRYLLDYFADFDESYLIYPFSRNHLQESNHLYCDLSLASTFPLDLLDSNTENIFISLAPIYLFKDFLDNLSALCPDLFSYLSHIIVCSSSSALTKKYAYNEFDIELSKSLNHCHDFFNSLAKLSSCSVTIVQPAIVYGSYASFSDKNITRIKSLMLLPFLFLPSECGLRQPIHGSQLAKIFLHLCLEKRHDNFSIFSFGGDDVISYYNMIDRLRRVVRFPLLNLSIKLPILIAIPSRFFFFAVSPLILISPKLFEAFLRMRANLSGFTKSCDFVGGEPASFPVLD